MKRSLFALSLLMVLPVLKASDNATSENAQASVEQTPVVETLVVETPAVEVVPSVEQTPVIENTPAVEVKAPSVFAKGYEKISNGVLFVKDGAVKSVISAKDNVVYAYDVTTGTIEKYTPSMILNARDSVRNVVASYPLAAVALTAFVAVKASQYFSASFEAEENEDDSF